MRGRELIALKLPRMVEAQRREEENMPPASPASLGHGSNQLSQSSTISDMSLNPPTTPSASVWSYPKVPSSASSLPSSPLIRESFDGYGSSKRPLTDLKEETEERDDDVEMANGIEQRPLERELSCESSPIHPRTIDLGAQLPCFSSFATRQTDLFPRQSADL